jgi:NAD(P)-dependent dehydrogenase (short-subunit alcohol dehydrogenase family)
MMDSSNATNRGAVVITGTSTGIGRACALTLDRMGFTVFAGVRREEDGNSLKKEASARLTPLMIDVTDNDSVERAFGVVEKSVGEDGLAGLINNAGIAIVCPLEGFSHDLLWKQLQVNLVGQIAVTQKFLPLIRKRRGRIINIGSIGGIQSVPFFAPYDASKAGLHALTDSLRMELSAWSIPVILIIPGHIGTPIWGRMKRMKEELPLPSNGADIYASLMDSFYDVIGKMEKGGLPPEAVAEVVAKALTAKRPKSRYIVGRDAKIQSLMAKVFSDRFRDRLVLRSVGLAGKNKP